MHTTRREAGRVAVLLAPRTLLDQVQAGTGVPVLADELYQWEIWKDEVDRFRRQMLDLQGRCMEYLFDYQGLVMTLNEERNYTRAFESDICHRPFN